MIRAWIIGFCACASVANAQDVQYSSDQTGIAALRDMERTWIIHSDVTCDFERSIWGGGTGSGPAQIGCLLAMTGEQRLYLESAWIGG